MEERRAPVQGERSKGFAGYVPAGTITWEEHLEVWAAYDKKWRCGQTAERIAERCGFGKQEAEDLVGRPLRTWRPV